jgi:hypothetical protein
MIARASHQAEASGDSRVEPSSLPGDSRVERSSLPGASRVERSSLRGKAFNLPQTFAAIWASGIVPPSIIDSEFLERLK